jgi:hypothetical protein
LVEQSAPMTVRFSVRTGKSCRIALLACARIGAHWQPARGSPKVRAAEHFGEAQED